MMPNNMECFISFSCRQSRFIDGLTFLNASLDKLVASTPKSAFTFTSTLQNQMYAGEEGDLLVQVLRQLRGVQEASVINARRVLLMLSRRACFHG